MEKLFRRLFPSKEMRRYRKMHRRHSKEIIKLAIETAEYDWCWLHEMVIMQIRHMYEYYSAGDNVWQTDETRLPIIEQLEHIINLQDELNRVESDTCGVEIMWNEDNDRIVNTIRPYNFKERMLKQEERTQELYEEIYGSIGKNIRGWWD